MKNLILILAFCLVGGSLYSENSLHVSPMTYEEIIQFEKPKQVLLSNNGDNFAFVSKQGMLSQNKNLEIVYIHNIKTGEQHKILAADEIKQLAWGTDKSLYALLVVDGIYKIVLFKDQQKMILKESNEQISLFALSGNGEKIFYSLIKEMPSDKQQERLDEGFVYHWETDTLNIIDMPLRDSDEVWSLDSKSGMSEFITSISYADSFHHYPVIESILVSEQGNYLLLSVKKKVNQS